MRRRAPLGVGISLMLWAGVGAGAYAFVATRHPAPSRVLVHAVGQAAQFSHVYPPDPSPYERPAVGTGSPVVAAADRLPTKAAVTSIRQLAGLVGRGGMKQARGAWVLTRPLELTAGTSLELAGPLALDLAPGTFIVAEHGAVLALIGVSVTGIGSGGAPDASPLPTRAFIDARDGARLVLRNDTFTDLGHLGDQSYGLTLDAASPLSQIEGCSIRSDYFGIYLSKLTGGQIIGNQVTGSVVYGIDPHTYDSNLVIERNTVSGSGVHGIVLADHASHNTVTGNVVANSHDHGILVFQYSDGNLVEDNRVVGTFDGIVVQDSSDNRIVGNDVGPVSRFGLRVSGLSGGNLISHNTLASSIVGAYLYQGANNNQLRDNTFRGNYENVRIRSDAVANSVTPAPDRSEL